MTISVEREAGTEEPARAHGDVLGRGARVRYVEVGRGPVLVLLHDMLSSSLEWDDVVTQLARKFRVVTIDLPGHGESEKLPPSHFRYGFDAFADAIIDVIAALGTARVHLCGRALGALVAITVAAKYPAVVDRLALVAPDVYERRRPWTERAAGWPVVGSVFYKQLFGHALFSRYFRAQLADRSRMNTARVDALFASFDEPAAREAAYATLLALQDTRSVVARLARVSAPTLVISGRHDRFASVTAGRKLARELERGRFEVLECAHSPAEEIPDTLVSVLGEFLLTARTSERDVSRAR